MKMFILAATALFSMSSFAAPASKIVLDCHIDFGPDQQVTVRQTSKGLILEELTNGGSYVTRPLSTAEFKSGVINLRIESSIDSGTLTLQNGEWIYDLGGAYGTASCRVKPRL